MNQALGNSLLVEHGIQTEESDYRLHISFAYAKAYFFPTEAGRNAVEAGLGKPFRASQPGVEIITGTGSRVMWTDITGCHEIDFPATWLKAVECKQKDTPSEKGRKAVLIARWLLRTGRVPLPPLTIREVEDKDIQIRGTDLIVALRVNIQVKCDYFAKRLGLALQTHECNPFGSH